MSEKEFGLFAMALKTYFPKDNLFPNKQAVDLWYRVLGDIDYKTAELFLQKWVATNKWSPTIADIREGCANITSGEMPDWGKAWEQVEKAIRNYGMYRENEAYASMDEITEEVTRRLGFKEICTSENIQIDRANFRMIYEQVIERKKTDRQVTPSVKNLIEQTQQTQKTIETHTVEQIEAPKEPQRKMSAEAEKKIADFLERHCL